MSHPRRHWLSRWPVLGAALAGSVAGTAPARGAAAQAAKEPRMPGDPPEHRMVYQLNGADPGYMEHILVSVGALIGKYGDNVAIAVVAFGPGIHLLARQPRRPVPEALRARAASQARDYGVRFVACGNTMKTFNWTAADMVP